MENRDNAFDMKKLAIKVAKVTCMVGAVIVGLVTGGLFAIMYLAKYITF